MKVVQRLCEVSQKLQGLVYLDKPLCSMEGVAMTTQGPMSSRCWEDLRWVTCLNMKGLEACTAHGSAGCLTTLFAPLAVQIECCKPHVQQHQQI